MSETESVNVDALAALVKQQAALIEQLSSKLNLQEQVAAPKLLDINDVRAQPDPKFRAWSTVYRMATPESPKEHVLDGIENRIVISAAERAEALAAGWKPFAHLVGEPEPIKKGKAA